MTFLKKRYIATAVGVISTGLIASYLLSDKGSRSKLKVKFNDLKNGILAKKEYEFYSTLEEAGIPDQLDRFDLAQIENAKMVSEGSQYGVNYYNEMQEENQKFKH